jgi:serine/threonine-protein phosphatase 2A activator
MNFVKNFEMYVVPAKKITSPADVVFFQKSSACESLTSFILAVNDAVKGQPCSVLPLSAAGGTVLAMLSDLSAKVDEIRPIPQPMRFGNKAFRTWHEEMSKIATSYIATISADAAAELSPYVFQSFGDPTVPPPLSGLTPQRLDYGTGHETAFVAFLCCLAEIGALTAADLRGVGLTIFPSYVALVRKIITTYVLEPAGSHGVWCLDDHHIVPYLWGAAQLIGSAGGGGGVLTT